MLADIWTQAVVGDSVRLHLAKDAYTQNRKLIAVRGNSSLNILPVLRPTSMSAFLLHACTHVCNARCKAFNIAATLAYLPDSTCCYAAVTDSSASYINRPSVCLSLLALLAV